MANPWFISEKDAAAREAAAARQLCEAVRRCDLPGLTGEALLVRLAARGFGAAELRRLLPLLRGHANVGK